MGRIEYEYPLFKVYYSNNSNIRGNPDHTNIVRCRHQVLRPCEAGEVGTSPSVSAPVAGDRGWRDICRVLLSSHNDGLVEWYLPVGFLNFDISESHYYKQLFFLEKIFSL